MFVVLLLFVYGVNDVVNVVGLLVGIIVVVNFGVVVLIVVVLFWIFCVGVFGIFLGLLMFGLCLI